ncbi:MAG: acetyl-CoA carboxylase, carboxyltransferase subunit beta [Brockia lithotrophica]|nr:acetyl-CoA carboxylase, carboxyltransferase subunit beta [Brockia lithotrophica]
MFGKKGKREGEGLPTRRREAGAESRGGTGGRRADEAPTAARQTKDIPEGLVEKCPSCGAILYRKELEANFKVCPRCGYHFPLSAPERIAITFDGGHIFEYDRDLVSEDPLAFPGYREKLAEAQERTGLTEAVVTGEGTIEGFPVVAAVMDGRFIMGSMGSVVGEKVARAAEMARAKRYPLVLFAASGGARMQEGILSLMQMAKTAAAVRRLADAGVLFVSVFTHPTTGGVLASFAGLGDILLAEPGALIGFTGRRIIEQTIREKLPPDFQTAEFLFAHGQLDGIVPRRDMRPTLAKLLRLHAAERRVGGGR